MEHVRRFIAERDMFARHLGIEITEAARGYARAVMPLDAHHRNGVGMAHGGAIFAVADLAFAVACNTRGKVSVTLDAGNGGSERTVLSGALLSLANPYFLLWWAVIGLGFLTDAYRDFAVWGVAIFFFGHIAADFVWYGLISTVVGTTRKFIKDKPYRIIIMVLGGLLIFFGIQFLLGAAGTLARVL